MFKHNLTACLNLQRAQKGGKYALRLRTIIQRKVTYYPTGITLLPEQWDDINKLIINHPQKVAYNALLRNITATLENELIQAALKGVAYMKPKKKNADFIAFCESTISEQQRKDKPATTRHKNGDLNILRKYKPVIPFNSITPEFLYDFEDWCKKELGNSNNTVWGHIKFIKGMLNVAAKADLYNKKLLGDYKAPAYVDPERDYLLLEELDSIEVFRSTTTVDKLRNVADWFLFSCYTGMRYEDVRTFSKEKIRQGKIVLRTSKKGTDVTLAVHPRLQAVIDRMPAGVYTDQKCNEYLKIIAAGAGLNQHITMHVGRHSFAVIFLEMGGRIESLRQLLGHKKISTTLIYGKITNKQLDEEMRKVWG